jgi:hypothetical protein
MFEYHVDAFVPGAGGCASSNNGWDLKRCSEFCQFLNGYAQKGYRLHSCEYRDVTLQDGCGSSRSRNSSQLICLLPGDARTLRVTGAAHLAPPQTKGRVPGGCGIAVRGEHGLHGIGDNRLLGIMPAILRGAVPYRPYRGGAWFGFANSLPTAMPRKRAVERRSRRLIRGSIGRSGRSGDPAGHFHKPRNSSNSWDFR